MDPTTLQQLGLTEDQIAQLMQLGVLEDERGTINKEMEIAQQLRQTPGPQGRFTGKAYVGANPMEFLGRGLKQIRGGMEEQKGLKRQRENAKRQAELRQQYLSILLKNQNPATVTPPQVPQAPMGMGAPQRTPAQMFPMPAGGRPAGATMTPGMMGR